MKKIMSAAVLLLSLVTTSSHAWDQRPPLSLGACAVHSPWGIAQTRIQLQPICRQGYLSAYDPAAKIPNYVAYTLQPGNALGCVPRTNAFVADSSIKGGPRPDDYAGTGYDKGHGAPDGDLSWDVQVEYESFLMTNMFPQAGSLNRGIWKLLETSIRGWSVQGNTTYTIYVGAVYTPADKTIGAGVVVPSNFYKIVVNQKTGEIAGWVFPHKPPYPNLGNDLTKFRVPVADIMSGAGVKFGLPRNAVELQPGREWPVDFGQLTAAKRAKCGASKD